MIINKPIAFHILSIVFVVGHLWVTHPSLPLANRLEKSVSVRLKRASPPTLSQDSRFFAARSLKELTILLPSSKLLFFCKNPKRLQEGEESAEWLHFPYMTSLFFLLFYVLY